MSLEMQILQQFVACHHAIIGVGVWSEKILKQSMKKTKQLAGKFSSEMQPTSNYQLVASSSL
jgi:hypothetical protein